MAKRTAKAKTIMMAEALVSEAPAGVIEDVVSILEAEDQDSDEIIFEDEENEDEVSEDQASEDEAKPSFDQMMANISAEEKLVAVKAIAGAIDERAAFEAVNGHPSIQKNFKKARDAFCLPSAGGVLLACGTDATFFNRSMHDGKRYNVYALGKLADIVGVLRSSDKRITNDINNAIMRSLFAARRAGVAFTGEVAKMAASDKIRVADKAITAILVRHTVSASTAPTQASSTMQALETLGIVRREGSHKNPTFTLTDHPAVAKLEEALAKAA